MDNPPSTALQKVYEELKAGNPFIILAILLVLVLSGSLWVWQTTHNPVVNTPTPRFSHPSAVAPFVPSIARTPSAVTPHPVTATPTPTPTRALSNLGHVSLRIYALNWQVGRSSACASTAGYR